MEHYTDFTVLFFTSLGLTFAIDTSPSVLFSLCPGSSIFFFLELLVFLSTLPSSILDTFQPGGSHLPVLYLFTIHTFHGFLKAKILKWIAISPSSKTLHYNLSILVALHGIS